MSKINLYILAVRVNGEELIANILIGKILNPMHFTSLEDAKDLFSDFYKVLAAGPTRNTALFANFFEKLAIFRPAFVKLPADKAVQIITSFRIDNQIVEFDKISLLLQPLNYFKVKPGFIDKYIALDVLEDIESIPSVGPDGKILINKFNIHDDPDETSQNRSLTEEDAKEILRKRGLL